jgi:glycosyltransferase involved in cell wall biosynthesis
MYLGVAAISTKAGGSRHAIEDGLSGFLMDEVDPEGQIGRLLVRLHDDPRMRQQMAEEARRSVAQRFLIGRMTEEITAFAAETILRHPAA